MSLYFIVYIFIKRSTVWETCILRAVTPSRVASLNHLLPTRRVEGCSTQYVKVTSYTTADVKCASSLTGIGTIVMTDTIFSVAPTNKTKAYLYNVSPAAFWDPVSGICFLIKNTLCILQPQALENTLFQPETTLNGLLKRPVCESVKSRLSSAEL